MSTRFRCPSTNEVRFAGYLCADIDYDISSKRGTFRVANNRSFQRNGKWQEDTTFMSFVVWGLLAERRTEMKKGDAVSIEGRIRSTSWMTNGAKRYGTEIVCKKIDILQSKEEVAVQESDTVPIRWNGKNLVDSDGEVLLAPEASAALNNEDTDALEKAVGDRGFEMPLTLALVAGEISGTQFEELARLCATTGVTFSWNGENLVDSAGEIIENDQVTVHIA
jgi:single stranded DNA-binding protein